jgi:ABC-type Fe3+/spermidine/putrescine transport system ATPase subunit
MAFLGIHGLRKTYGAVTALDGIDLEVERGEFVTLLGPSGSGKTTLLMSIGGFVKPSAGAISLEARDITRLEPEDRNLGLVFQGYALFPHMSVTENIAFPLRIRRWEKRRIAARVEEMLALVEMSAMARRKPRELSGGQQQRVALARALSFDPEVLLLDEPLSALDRTLREIMQRELKRLHRETGVTFLYVTHDQEEAISMSDRVAVFQNGRIVQIGTPRQMYDRPASRFVAEFLGTNNILDGRIVAGPVGPALEILGTILRRDPEMAGDPVGTTRTLWFRPEHAERSEPPEPSIAITGQVKDVAFLGAFERIVFSIDGARDLLVQFPGGSQRSPVVGDCMTFHVPVSSIGLLPRG